MSNFCHVLPKVREKQRLPKRKFWELPTEVLLGVQSSASFQMEEYFLSTSHNFKTYKRKKRNQNSAASQLSKYWH